jgi:hypothetical protein
MLNLAACAVVTLHRRINTAKHGKSLMMDAYDIFSPSVKPKPHILSQDHISLPLNRSADQVWRSITLLRNAGCRDEQSRAQENDTLAFQFLLSSHSDSLF